MDKNQSSRRNVSIRFIDCVTPLQHLHIFFAAERKVEELMDKYEDLKKNNKVQKYIEKKAKKNRRIDINTHDT